MVVAAVMRTGDHRVSVDPAEQACKRCRPAAGVLTTPRPPTIIARDVSRRVALQLAVWIVTLFCVALMFAAPLRQLIWYFGQGADGIP
ncbi:MAG: hypothetical protein ACREJ9_07200 [Candidatus Rokuibacteriota bacterium]